MTTLIFGFVLFAERVFTQDIQPPDVLEAGNDTVLVKFMSDGSYEDQGFNITFQEKGLYDDIIVLYQCAYLGDYLRINRR